MNGLDYTNLVSSESVGSTTGGIGVKILVATTAPINLKSSKYVAGDLHDVAYQALEAVKNALVSAVLEADPAMQDRKVRERASVISLFPEPIFVEEVPNGYYGPSDPWGKLSPWFVVTTTIGRFKVGWRKRVMHVEWTETLCKRTADQLFPTEDVTKSDRMIHAWSLEKAKEYVKAILESQA